MRKIITFITFILLGFLAFSQNTSPLVVKDFVLKSNEIIDLEQIPKFNRTDLDNNPICRIKVKAQGFEESVLQKLVFVPNGIEITHMVFKDGQWLLHVSSHKTGEITIKYMGDCVFRLPYQLEPSKVYELTLAMETATLAIRTIPTNAEIYIDNEKVGVGEAIKAVSIGAEHRYRVVCENYYTKEGVVQFSKREEKSINIELESNFGYITIKSEPAGVDIYIDDVKVGITPYLMKSIKLGNHVVELRKMGYENYAKMVTVQAGIINTQLENVSLVAREMVYGSLTVYSDPEGANIMVDNEFKGKTPQTINNILTGTHEVVLSKAGYVTVNRTITVLENDNAIINEDLAKGSKVTIATDQQGDKIFVDGDYAGESPVRLTVDMTEHTVEAYRGESTDLEYYRNSWESMRASRTIAAQTPGDNFEVILELEKYPEIYINTGQTGDKLFLDEKYLGLSPMKMRIPVGYYTIVAVRGGEGADFVTLKYTDGVMMESATINVVKGGGTKMVTLTFPVGAGYGVYSVGDYKKVYISKGNLQYQPSTKTWRFANYQWSTANSKDNQKCSAKSDAWIDVFHRGTGDNPTLTNSNEKKYAVFHDWGDNHIENGDTRKWRTIGTDELKYLLFKRYTVSGMRYAKGEVAGVWGIVIFPDDWNPGKYKFEHVNEPNAQYNTNKISMSDWKEKIEPYGVTFLPYVTRMFVIGKSATIGVGAPTGYYWTNSGYLQFVNDYYTKADPSKRYLMEVISPFINAEGYSNHKHAVRLVSDVE